MSYSEAEEIPPGAERDNTESKLPQISVETCTGYKVG